MILNMQPLSLAQARKIAGDLENKPELDDYFKKFSILEEEKAEALVKSLKGLNNLKLKDEHIVKIVDFLPRDGETILKILNDVSLDEKEIQAILELVKEY